jgi:hypothetical protein
MENYVAQPDLTDQPLNSPDLELYTVPLSKMVSDMQGLRL